MPPFVFPFVRFLVPPPPNLPKISVHMTWLEQVSYMKVVFVTEYYVVPKGDSHLVVALYTSSGLAELYVQKYSSRMKTETNKTESDSVVHR